MEKDQWIESSGRNVTAEEEVQNGMHPGGEPEPPDLAIFSRNVRDHVDLSFLMEKLGVADEEEPATATAGPGDSARTETMRENVAPENDEEFIIEDIREELTDLLTGEPISRAGADIEASEEYAAGEIWGETGKAIETGGDETDRWKHSDGRPKFFNDLINIPSKYGFWSRSLYGPVHIGLDIGSHSVKFVVVRKRKSHPKILGFGICRNPLGPDAPVEDQIQQICDYLELRKHFPHARISWALRGQDVGLKRTSLPVLKKKMFEEALLWTARKEFNLEEAPAAITYLELGQTQQKGAPKIDVLMAGVREDAVLPAAHVFVKNKFLPFHAKPLAVVLWKLYLESEVYDPERTVALIDIGASKTTIVFVHQGKLLFSRELPTGGRHITDALTATLFYQGMPYQLQEEEAEELKLRYGFPTDDLEEKTKDGVPVSEYAVLIRPILERLGSEIQRSLDYFRDTFNVPHIEKLYLLGGTAHLKNLTLFLSDIVDGEMELFPIPDWGFGKGDASDAILFKEHFHELAIAYALASDFTQDLNLLPKSIQRIETFRLVKRISIYAALILSVLILMASAYLHLKGISLKNQYRVVQLRYRQMEPLKKRFDALRREQIQLRRKKEIYSREFVLDNPLPPALKVAANLFPRGMAITDLVFQETTEMAEGQPVSPPGKQKKEKETVRYRMEIYGVVHNPGPEAGIRIAEYMLWLRKSGLFASVHLKNQYMNDEMNDLRFVVEAVLK